MSQSCLFPRLADILQLTKGQLASVLPLLVQHLASGNYVISSYAAITIERILFIKLNRQAQWVQRQTHMTELTMPDSRKPMSGRSPKTSS